MSETLTQGVFFKQKDKREKDGGTETSKKSNARASKR